jgi:hypothetical protein
VIIYVINELIDIFSFIALGLCMYFGWRGKLFGAKRMPKMSEAE